MKRHLQLKKYTFLIFLFTAVTFLLTACSSDKFIPENSYYLKTVKIKTKDKQIEVSSLKPYIRQKENSKWFSLFKLPLGVYDLSGRDTTKWMNKTLKKIGEPPVIYDSLLTEMSKNDLIKVLQDRGYINADVKVVLRKKNKKIKVNYLLDPKTPFYLRKINYLIEDDSIAKLLRLDDESNQGLKEGMPFMVETLDNERKRITKLLNDKGYYRFHKDFIIFHADSVTYEHGINLTLRLLKNINAKQEFLGFHSRYKINQIIYGGNEAGSTYIRNKTLLNNTMIEQGDYYSNEKLLYTYHKFSRLPAIRYTNIKFEELPDTNLLNTYISFSTNKINTLSLRPEGTNTAGDLGAAVSAVYENRNLFHGGEKLTFQARGAFEAITRLEGYKDKDYQEYSIDGKLTLPSFVAPFLSKTFRRNSNAISEWTIRYDLQNRPEFHRRVFSTSWRYKWKFLTDNLSYRLDLLDIDYIYMPWLSETFKRDYLDNVSSRNVILRYNYQNLFIVKWGFGLAFNNAINALKLNIESAGNAVHFISKMTNATQNKDNQYTLFNIAYAQYIKGDVDYTHLLQVDERNSFAFHVGFGIAYPYGNSHVLPFEKRYFSGGANSVRGWSVRSLGPGSYAGADKRIDFINQTGDMKVDLNVEYRTFLFWKLYGAAFVDAGNIWTLHSYAEQQGGQFKLNEFYKQLAMGYGIGFRFNFDYFILRFDLGMKAVNPAYRSGKEHYPIWHPNLKRDMAFHFAVGLPF